MSDFRRLRGYKGGFKRVFRGVPSRLSEFQRDSLEFKRSVEVQNSFMRVLKAFSEVLKGFRRFQNVSRSLRELVSGAFVEFQRSLRIFMKGYKACSWISEGFMGISKV